MTNNVASIKDKLRNQSIITGKTMQELFTIYGLERTIYRISISKYVENFTLKGGILLYALFDKNYARVTTDIDFLAQKINNEINYIKKIFEEIFSLKVDDPLNFDLNTLLIIPITEFKKYHGVNVSITALLDRTKIPISIDIGFGDVIYPEKVKLNFPTVLSHENPKIFAYSLVSTVSEKFEAIVSLAYNNSRFKDFYDLYVLAKKLDFDGLELSEALRKTFYNRHTKIDKIAAFEDNFVNESIRQSRWKSFVKKKKTIIPVTLEEVIEEIKIFISPVLHSIKEDKVFTLKWNAREQTWR